MDRELKIGFKKLALSSGAQIVKKYKKGEVNPQPEEVVKMQLEMRGFKNEMLMDLRKAGVEKRDHLKKFMVTKKYGAKR